MATNPNVSIYIGDQRYTQGDKLTPYQMNWLRNDPETEKKPDYVLKQYAAQGGDKAVDQADKAANPPESSSTVNQPAGVVTDAASNREFINNGGGAATGIRRVQPPPPTPVPPTPAPADNKKNDDAVNKGTVKAQAGDVGLVNTAYKGLTGSNKIDALYPGARKDNPLSFFSSYTYGLTLYMCTPDYTSAYMLNEPAGTLPTGNAPDGRPWDKQLFVVAQSGGINNRSQNRAFTNDLTGGLQYPPLGNYSGFNNGLDFYIDDLTFKTQIQDNTVNSDFKFKITEPQGFSLIQRLRIAVAELNVLSDLLGKSGTGSGNQIGSASAPGLRNQNYILAIRFYGYDAGGEIVLPTSVPEPYAPRFPPSVSTSIAERFFPITISEMNFKLGSGSTVYDCSAVLTTNKSQGLDNGLIKTTSEVQSYDGTVGAALDSLMAKLNKDVRDIFEKNPDTKDMPLTTYSWEELPLSATRGPIGSSLLIDDKDIEKLLTPFASKLNVTQSNSVANQFTNAAANIKGRSLSFAAGKKVLSAIDDIIVKSNFVTQSLVGVTDGEPETVSTQIQNNTPLRWYSVNVVTTIKGFNTVTNNWNYDILYQLRIYDVPYVRSSLVKNKSIFRGPYKYYPYFFTGQNQEVLDFEVDLNNLYLQVVGLSAADLKLNTAQSDAAIISFQGGVPGAVEGGKLNKGSEHNNAVRATLFSPDSLAKAKLKIMGDPDYLMPIVGVYQKLSSDARASVNEIYGPDFTINPFTGQVHIQVYFKTAEDYNNPGYNGKPNDGLLDVTDQLQFYNSKQQEDNTIQNSLSKNGIDGLIYKVMFIDSTFSKGQFTQMLDCVQVDSTQLLTGRTPEDTSQTIKSENADPTVNATPGTPNANENQTYDEFGTPIPKARIEKQVAGYQGDLIAADAAATAAAGGATTAPKTEQGNNGDKTLTTGAPPVTQGRDESSPYAPNSIYDRAYQKRSQAAKQAAGGK
jgi:hypothetical protein